MRLLQLLAVLVMVGCAQSNDFVPIAGSPSYMLRVGRVEVLDGMLGNSAFGATELRMDPAVEGERVVAMLVAPWGEPAVYAGDAAASPLRLTPESTMVNLQANGSRGPHQLTIEAVVIDGYVEDGLLRMSGDVDLEGTEQEQMVSSGGGPYPAPFVSGRVRAASVARVDDIAPEAMVSSVETRIGGILPWERLTFRSSEPIDPAGLEAATGSDVLTFEETTLRGQVVRAGILPETWWSAMPSVSFPSGISDRIPNNAAIAQASFRRIAEIAPQAGFDFEASDEGILRASDGTMFHASTLGCYGGSAGCLGFSHGGSVGFGDPVSQHSELFARLDGTISGIRLRVRILAEASMYGSTPSNFTVRVRAAGEGSPTETVATASIVTEVLPVPMDAFVSDSGWQEVALDFAAPVEGAGVFITFDSAYGWSSWESLGGSGAAARAAPPPVPAATVLVDDLGAI